MTGKRRLALVALLVVQGIAFVALTPRRGDRAAAPAARVPPAPAEPREALPMVEAAPALASRSAEEGPALAVDLIDVEKASACRGEENLVSVVAHARDPRDTAWIRVEVNGVAGDRVPIRTYGLDEPGSEPVPVTRRLVVRSRGGAAVEKVLPQLAVRDCQRPRELLVSHEVDPATDGRVSFHAQLVAAPGVEGEVARYRWTFDDGEAVETTSPDVVHDYAGRAQETAVTSLLVACEARTSDGHEVVGRDALTLENPFFAARADERAPVPIVGHPAESVRDGGATRVTMRLRNGVKAPVRLTRVTRQRHRWSTLGTSPSTERLDPASLAPAGELPPGGSTATFTLDATDPELVADEYVVEGSTPGGRPARGHFFVRAADVPGRLLARLERPAFRERLVRARDVLGVARVTEQDVYDLEHTDAFADLPPEMP